MTKEISGKSLEKVECARSLSEPERQTTELYKYWALPISITKEPPDVAEILNIQF